MSNNSKIDFTPMEGQTFIIGREGHIYINSLKVSKYHAEIKIIGGRIYLRDLNSTNGTYLVKDEVLVHFEEGWVQQHQVLVIGDERRTVQSLLAVAIGFCDTDDTVTINHESAFKSINRSINRRSVSREQRAA